jgi:hypothetical protein
LLAAELGYEVTMVRNATAVASFENSDHVPIVIHNYRWRLGLADGEAKYDDMEKRLAVGHNLPQEAPQAVAKAIVDVDAFDRPEPAQKWRS